ncbi:MAG TPA: cobalamin-dependent protein [Actinomycetota bacterium]|nr:cobalamin-dependent protein [Actinomycetota bacterium]
MSEEHMEQLRQALIKADRESGLAATEALLAEGADPVIILQDAMAVAMFTLGAMWSRGEVFLPEVVASATLFKMCNDLVEPALLAAGGEKQITGKVILATVKGDLHDLGKNMVGAMLKTAGFEVTDLGKDTPTQKILDAVRELEPDIVGMSALLTTTVPQQKVVIEALKKEGLFDKVKVMVGGAPVTQEWADEIGADGFAPDAPEAVSRAKALLGVAV